MSRLYTSRAEAGALGNQVGTLLLAPSLAAAMLVGVVGAAAIGLLLLVTVGWSRAGADGGGVLVAATAFAVEHRLA